MPPCDFSVLGTILEVWEWSGVELMGFEGGLWRAMEVEAYLLCTKVS